MTKMNFAEKNISLDTSVSSLEKFLVDFSKKNNITREQASLLNRYAEIVVEWNEKFNLTAKTKVETLFRDLIADALQVFKFKDFSLIKSFADVGTGAGIPGLVLKIVRPDLKVVLIEVNSKKRLFLEYVVKQLQLTDVEISDLDWRTFNRKTNYNIDLFVTKAAFSDDEIVRMFRKNCNYTDKRLIYWASSKWTPSKNSEKFVKEKFEYVCAGKKNQFVLFASD